MASPALFTISNGQIYTPGFVVVDAPQPGTPVGGALDVTANGRLPLPEDIAHDSLSRVYEITVFLSSYTTGRNFTVSNGSASADGAVLGPILAQEPGSTVKHVAWTWPDCFVTGKADSAQGSYNISVRQRFRLNDVDHYTVFDLPVSVTNTVDETFARPACASLENALLGLLGVDAIGAAADDVGILFAPGDATQVDVYSNYTNADAGTDTGLGPPMRPATDKDGLGSAARQTRPSILLSLFLLAFL